MTDKMDRYLQQIAIAQTASQKAALIAEMSFSRLPIALSQTARRCAFLPYFTPELVEAVLGSDTGISLDQAMDTLLAFSFVETHPLGHSFHAATRSGLLDRYATQDPQEIQSAYRAILPVLRQGWQDNDVVFLLLVCLNILGEAEEFSKRLDELLERLGDAGDYQRIHALFASIQEYSSQAQAVLLPLTVDQATEKAYASFLAGDYSQAQIDLTTMIQLDPGDAKAYYNRGLIYARLGNNDAAQDDYTKAIRLDPGLAQAYYNRGLTYAQFGNNDAALDDYSKAIQLDPGYAKAYNNRGLTYAKLGNYDAALDDYSKAIQLNPGDAAAYNNRGNTYAQLGNNDAALDDYSKAIQLDPGDAAAIYNTACIYSLCGEVDQACQWLTRAIEMDSKLQGVAASDKDFYPIRNEPCFKLLLE